jgi:hypothetical protein
MALTSAGSVTLAGLVVLQAPRAVDPHKGPRNVVFDANFYVVEGSQTVTMALLRFFAPTEMADDIQKMSGKPFQKAFIVANVMSLYIRKTIKSFFCIILQKKCKIMQFGTNSSNISNYTF